MNFYKLLAGIVGLFGPMLSFDANATEPLTTKIQLEFRPGPKLGVIANATIKGLEFPLLIDTGASGHDLDQSLVHKLELPLRKAGTGTTPAGDIQTVDIGTIKIRVDGTNIVLENTITVMNDPSGLIEDHIFGLMSPPKLATDKLVVLDLAEPALYLVSPIPEHVSQWLKNKFKDFEFDEMPLLDAAPFVEQVTVESPPYGKMKMTVDSGAIQTVIYAGGINAKYEGTKKITLRFGTHECTTQLAIVRPSNAPGHQNHLLGMDCLRGKVLGYLPPNYRSTFVGWPLK